MRKKALAAALCAPRQTAGHTAAQMARFHHSRTSHASTSADARAVLDGSIALHVDCEGSQAAAHQVRPPILVYSLAISGYIIPGSQAVGSTLYLGLSPLGECI